MGIKKHHTNEFKSKVALAALREDRTTSELAVSYGVHPIQVGLWKKAVIKNAARVFGDSEQAVGHEQAQQALMEKLYRKIGEIEVENDWLKKKLGL